MLNLIYKKLLQDKVTKDSLEEYFSLIESVLCENRTRKRKTDPNYIYYECHHILPRSLFPELIKAKDNKVLLTAREHFIAHKLLFNSIPCQPLGHAFWKMACCNKDIADVTPEEYEEARLVYLSLPRWNKGRMVGQANFSHKELQNKSCNLIQEMLYTQKTINWHDFSIHYKRGTAVIKTEDGWFIDMNMPELKGEDRNYVERFIYCENGVK